MEVWITRQRNGDYMLTEDEPIFSIVKGTPYIDAYVPYGDPVGIRHLCNLMLRISGIETPLARGQSAKIEITGKLLFIKDFIKGYITPKSTD